MGLIVFGILFVIVFILGAFFYYINYLEKCNWHAYNKIEDENELAEMAFNEWNHNESNKINDFQHGFVQGYKKAMEKINYGKKTV